MGMTFLKKASPDRIKLILRVMNFLAAPFGTQEAVLVQYGVEGVDYTLNQDGNIVPTDQGKKEAVQFNYITAMAPVLYDPLNGKEFATVGHDWEVATAPAGVDDPITGLYSPADAKNGVTLAGDMYSGVQDIILGRRPLTDLDQLVKDWRSKGGDAIRAEYEHLLPAK
jgi:putative aldouronate transport system substrate-binding protein